MNRQILIAALAAALVPGLCAADATTVYKKKNADGTNTYSQTEIQGSESQLVNGRDPRAEADAAPAAEEKSDMQVACENATANVALYNSGKTLVKPATDGSEGTVPMTAEEIASGRDLAQRQVTAFCPPAEPPAED